MDDWDESWHGTPPGLVPRATMDDDEIVGRLDGKGECHGCGQLRELHPCLYESELFDDETETCCETCAPEHAMDI